LKGRCYEKFLEGDGGFLLDAKDVARGASGAKATPPPRNGQRGKI